MNLNENKNILKLDMDEGFICPKCGRLHFPKKSWNGSTMTCSCGAIYTCNMQFVSRDMYVKLSRYNYCDTIEFNQMVLTPAITPSSNNIRSKGVKIPLKNGEFADGHWLDQKFPTKVDMHKLCMHLNRKQIEQLVAPDKYYSQYNYWYEFDFDIAKAYCKPSTKVRKFFEWYAYDIKIIAIITAIIAALVGGNILAFTGKLIDPIYTIVLYVDAMVLVAGFVLMLFAFFCFVALLADGGSPIVISNLPRFRCFKRFK